jgi:prepilin-type N-terminal cleavage/methylation domain-containing protein
MRHQSAVRSQQSAVTQARIPLRTTNYGLRTTRGFTLIELVVTLAIITLISGLVLSNHAKFGSVVTLENLAYDSAFAVRKAQVYGISVYGSGTGSFAPGYGVYLNRSTPDRFWIFADTNGNGVYESGTEPQLETESYRSGYTITALCVTPTSGSEDCSPTRLDIVFRRPEPGAFIYANGTTVVQYSQSRFSIRSPQGDTKNVVVDVSGQITVR